MDRSCTKTLEGLTRFVIGGSESPPHRNVLRSIASVHLSRDLLPRVLLLHLLEGGNNTVKVAAAPHLSILSLIHHRYL